MHPSFFDEVARQRGIARLESADAERLAALVRRERRAAARTRARRGWRWTWGSAPDRAAPGNPA